MTTVQACLNGRHTPAERDGVPVSPAELARAAVESVAAGAESLHVHPKDDRGMDSVDPARVGAALSALRAVVDVPIGVTTAAWTEPDPARRVELIAGWQELPDFASVNWHEPGAGEVARTLTGRGVGIEAGLWTADAAGRFAEDTLARECLRVLVEVTEQDLSAGNATATAIERAARGLGLPLLVHGEDSLAWPMLDRAIASGLHVRIGLEDVAALPDGTPVDGNAPLVAHAVGRLRAIAAAARQLAGSQVRVTAEHRPPARAPIQVGLGEAVDVGERDAEWPAFVLVTTRAGESGWVPSRLLRFTGADQAVAISDYDTTELAVDAGAQLTVVEADTASGWLRCRRADGDEGWVPMARLDLPGVRHQTS